MIRVTTGDMSKNAKRIQNNLNDVDGDDDFLMLDIS